MSDKTNVLINYKTGTTYSELLPNERADGISFESTKSINSAIIGDGGYILPFPVKGFMINNLNVFIFNNLIYQYSNNPQSIKIYRSYSLRENEYFVDVNYPYLLTNMGRLYNATGVLLYDYQVLFNVSVDTKFTSFSQYSSFTQITTSVGLYYNNSGTLTSFTKGNFSGLSSEDFIYGDIINYNGNISSVAFVNSNELEVIINNLNTTVSYSIINLEKNIGQFKFLDSGVVVGTLGVWLPQNGNDENSILNINTNGYTCVIPYQNNNSGYLFNDNKYNILHLRQYSNDQNNISDLVTDITINTNTDRCFIYMINYDNINIGITNNGEIYNIN